ncbi:MAG: hypothetical protein ACI9PU_002056, partial [Ascidiaceihabitans sp.]
MSFIKKTASIAATALVGAYGVSLFVGPSISTEVEIAAPVSVVWEELTNGAAYPEWNPFVKHLSGDLEVGNYINVTIQSEGHSPMDF